MTHSPTSICPASDVEHCATLTQAYAYLIENDHQCKKHSAQPAGGPQLENLPPTAPLPVTENDPECPHT
jgi:hypothetical protein